MSETLSYDNTPEAEVLTSEEQDSLQVGEQLVAEQEKPEKRHASEAGPRNSPRRKPGDGPRGRSRRQPAEEQKST